MRLRCAALTVVCLSSCGIPSASGTHDDSASELVSIQLRPAIERIGEGGAWYPVHFAGVTRSGQLVDPLAGVSTASSDSSVAFVRNDSLYAKRVGEVYLTFRKVDGGREVTSTWYLRVTALLIP